ncbi:MAG: hypothetical protein ACLPX7_03770 [Xanthobacteraceae bacterium]
MNIRSIVALASIPVLAVVIATYPLPREEAVAQPQPAPVVDPDRDAKVLADVWPDLKATGLDQWVKGVQTDSLDDTLRIYLKDGVDVDQAYAALGQRYCGEFFTVPPLHRSGWFVCVLQTDENGAALQCTVGRANTR